MKQKLLLSIGFVVVGLALIAMPLLLAGVPLLVPLLVIGVALFVVLPILLVARLSRPKESP